MTSLVRSNVLEGYGPLARSLGIDAHEELSRVGLPIDCLENGETFVPFIAVIRLLEHTAKAGSCPDFGLRLVKAQADGVGPLTILMRHAATLEQALQIGARHLFVLSPEIHLAIQPVSADPRLVDITIEFAVPQLRARAQWVELSLGAMVQILGMVTQGQVEVQRALLPHARLGPPQSYASVLGCECQFDAPVAGIRLLARDLRHPLPGHNPLLHQMARSYIEENFGSPQHLFADRVRLLARRLLDSGSVSLPGIAEVLAVHPKTLQRRLQAEGWQFNAILDEVRRDRFLELVEQMGPFSLTQLALLLGYSEQAALSRSCRRWFDRSPSEMRQRAAATSPTGPDRSPIPMR